MMRFTRMGAVLVAAVLMGLPYAAAVAQEGAAAQPPALLAEQLLHLAKDALAGDDDNLREDQLVRAKVLMELALQLTPNEPELWSMRAELAGLQQDPKAQEAALLQVVRLQPGNDAALLRLLRLRLAQVQTLEERARLATAMLDGPAGAQLPATVRSRLASFVASAHNELGEESAYARRLVEAITLDGSNKAAASMAYELALRRKASAFDRGQALLALVRADPVDPPTRRALAGVLLELGLYGQAATQHAAASGLAGQMLDEAFYRNWALAQLGAGLHGQALQMLDQLSQVLNQRRQPPPAEGQPAAAAPADPTALPLPLQVLRLVALGRPESGADPAAADAVRALRDTVQQQGASLPTEEAAQLALLVLALAHDNALAPAAADALAREGGDEQPLVVTLRAWMAHRAGDSDKARTLIAPVAAEQPWATYLVAIMGDVKDPRRVAVLQKLARDQAGQVVGVVAAQTLLRADQSVDLSPEARRMASMMDRWPGYLRNPDFRVSPWTSLTLKVDPARFGYLEPMPVRMTLRNNTDLPLAIGDGAAANALPNQIMLLVAPRQAGQSRPLPPIVVDLARQLVLPPRSSLEVVERLDRSVLGRILASAPNETVGLSVTAVYDARTDAQGRVSTGPIGDIDTVSLVQYEGQPVTPENVTRWTNDLAAGPSFTRSQSLARLAVIAGRLPDDDRGRPLAEQMAAALNEAWPKLDGPDRAWVVRFIPATESAAKLFAGILTDAAASTDPFVGVMYLANHVSSADAATLEEALRSKELPIASFARALQLALRERDKTPATNATTP